MRYLTRIGAWISQGINTLFGGHNQVAVSSKTGYMSMHSDFKGWKYLEAVIDFTFYPIDGENHCRKAYQADPLEDFKMGATSGLNFLAVAIVACMMCLIIIAPFYLIGSVKKAVS